MQMELNTYLNDVLAMHTDCTNQCLQPTMAAMRYSHNFFRGYAGSSAQVHAIAP